MTKDEALKLALEALNRGESQLRWEAIAAIEEALAQPEQEPVLWGVKFSDGKFSPYAHWSKKDAERIALHSHLGTVAAALYTTPSHRKPLTDDEIEQGCKESWVTEQAFQSAVWWAETKLKEKNT